MENQNSQASERQPQLEELKQKAQKLDAITEDLRDLFHDGKPRNELTFPYHVIQILEKHKVL